MTDHQPLDLDAILRDAFTRPIDREAFTGQPTPEPEHEHEWDYDRSVCGFCGGNHGYCVACGETEPCDPPTPQPDPLDENDHRDRTVGDNVRLVRHGPRHWHPAPYTPCCRCPLSDPSLSFWARSSIGPLAFADDPQTPQEATSGTQTALRHTALAEVAEQAHRLSQAICDWLDIKEDQ